MKITRFSFSSPSSLYSLSTGVLVAITALAPNPAWAQFTFTNIVDTSTASPAGGTLTSPAAVLPV